MQRRSECGFDGILSWRNGLSSRRDGLESLTPDQRAQTLALDSCQHLRENEIGIGGGRNTAFTERNVDSRHELYPDTRVRHIASNDRNPPTPSIILESYGVVRSPSPRVPMEIVSRAAKQSTIAAIATLQPRRLPRHFCLVVQMLLLFPHLRRFSSLPTLPYHDIYYRPYQDHNDSSFALLPFGGVLCCWVLQRPHWKSDESNLVASGWMHLCMCPSLLESEIKQRSGSSSDHNSRTRKESCDEEEGDVDLRRG